MRDLSPELQAHLNSGATTLCRLFILDLKNGDRFAFSDHDRPLSFDGLVAKPMLAAETEQRTGFDVDSGAVRIVFDLDLSRDALVSGRLDDATLSEYRVNWADPTQFVLITKGRLGAVTVNDDGFEADWLGQSSLLERSTGRVFSRRCDAEFGDARCGLTAQPGQSCARTFEACKSHNNTNNFRGFPYLLGDDVLQKGLHLTPQRDGSSRYA